MFKLLVACKAQVLLVVSFQLILTRYLTTIRQIKSLAKGEVAT